MNIQNQHLAAAMAALCNVGYNAVANNGNNALMSLQLLRVAAGQLGALYLGMRVTPESTPESTPDNTPNNSPGRRGAGGNAGSGNGGAASGAGAGAVA